MLEQHPTLLLLIVVLIIYYAILSILNKKKDLSEFILTTLIIVSLYLILYTPNLFYLILLIEIQSFSLVILIVKKGGPIISSESGLKYLLPSALATGSFLMGIYTASYCWSDSIKIDLSLRGLLFFSFLVFKLGVVPFHIWFIDVLEGCSWSPLLTYILLPKLTITYILLTYAPLPSFLLVCMGILSIIVGSIGMLNQTKINRFLGYSSINSAG